MRDYIQYTDPEEVSESSTEREKELSVQFEDPGMDFLFSDTFEDAK